MSSNEGIAAELREHLIKRQNPLDSLGWARRNALVLAAVPAVLDRLTAVEAERDQILAALHVALRHADGTLANVPAEHRAEELAGCEVTLRRFANTTPLASPTPTGPETA